MAPRLEGLAEGALALCVQDAQRQAPLWLRIVEVGIGSATHLEVEIRTGGLEGTALRADGRAASGLEVQASGRIEGGHTRFETETDRSGGFRFEGLPVGPYEVLVEGAELRGQARRSR